MKKYLSLLLAVMMVLSTVSFAAPTAVATVESVNETVEVEDAAEAAEVALASETKSWHDEKKGIVLYDIDFDSIPASALATDKNGAAYIKPDKTASFDALGATNPALVGKNDWVVSATGAAGATVSAGIYVVDASGNKYGTLTTNGTSQEYPHFDCYSTSGKIYENGIFTVEYKLKVSPSSNVKNIRKGVKWLLNRAENDPHASTTIRNQLLDVMTAPDASDWTTVEYSFNKKLGDAQNYAYSVSGTNTTFAGSVQSLAEVYYVVYTQKTSGKTTVMFDDARLYWKPYTATVTIDVNGNSEAGTVAPLTAWDTTKPVTFAEVKKYVSDTASKKLVGISSSANGKPEEEIWITGDETIYLLWKTPETIVEKTNEYGQLLMHMDFDSGKDILTHIDENGNATRWLDDADEISGYASDFSSYTTTDNGFDASKLKFDVRAARNESFKNAQAVILETDENNDTHAKIQLSASQEYTFLHFGTTAASITDEEGVYTVVYDIMCDVPDLAGYTPQIAYWHKVTALSQTTTDKTWENSVAGEWVRDSAISTKYSAGSGALKDFYVGVDHMKKSNAFPPAST